MTFTILKIIDKHCKEKLFIEFHDGNYPLKENGKMSFIWPTKACNTNSMNYYPLVGRQSQKHNKLTE